MASPYVNLPVDQWNEKTKLLVEEHPLESKEIVEVVLQSWKDIFVSKIGPKKFEIGKDIFPQAQIMAFLLHELIPLEFASRHPKKWRRNQVKADKDLVYVANEKFSIEIKTSTNPSGIYGNRSYEHGDGVKKSGYYLIINFGGFNKVKPGVENTAATAETKAPTSPQVGSIRFGWFDHSDWKGQKAESGQAATPTPDAKKHKLVTLYKVVKPPAPRKVKPKEVSGTKPKKPAKKVKIS